MGFSRTCLSAVVYIYDVLVICFWQHNNIILIIPLAIIVKISHIHSHIVSITPNKKFLSLTNAATIHAYCLKKHSKTIDNMLFYYFPSLARTDFKRKAFHVLICRKQLYFNLMYTVSSDDNDVFYAL